MGVIVEGLRKISGVAIHNGPTNEQVQKYRKDVYQTGHDKPSEVESATGSMSGDSSDQEFDDELDEIKQLDVAKQTMLAEAVERLAKNAPFLNRLTAALNRRRAGNGSPSGSAGGEIDKATVLRAMQGHTEDRLKLMKVGRGPKWQQPKRMLPGKPDRADPRQALGQPRNVP